MENKNHRALIFIDGNNFYYKLKEISFSQKGISKLLDFNYQQFAKKLIDIAYLLSSDTDLVPAVEEVISLNKKVVYVGISKGQSFGLTRVSDNTILLREEDVLPYFVASELKKL